jgi:hypothetical protein
MREHVRVIRSCFASPLREIGDALILAAKAAMPGRERHNAKPER